MNSNTAGIKGNFKSFSKGLKILYQTWPIRNLKKRKEERERNGLRIIRLTRLFLFHQSRVAYSFDRNVHLETYACYSKLLKYLLYEGRFRSTAAETVQQSLPSSINRYVDNILCTEREKMCPEIKRLLTFLSDNCEDQTFKVEELNCVSKKICLFLLDFFGHKYVLQQIVLNFMDKLYVYPLDNTTFPERPGVYFIYHVGKTQLYEGLKPGRSLHTLSRLCRNLTRALQIASKTIAKKLRGQVNKSNRPKVNRQTRRDIQKGNTRRESNSQKMKKRKRKK